MMVFYHSQTCIKLLHIKQSSYVRQLIFKVLKRTLSFTSIKQSPPLSANGLLVLSSCRIDWF